LHLNEYAEDVIFRTQISAAGHRGGIFFIVLPGIRAWSHAKPCKNKLIPRSAVEIRVKASEAGVSNAGQVAECCNPACSFAPTAFHITLCRHSTYGNPSASAAVIPASATPIGNS
jgi:hypothetical protein